MALRFVVRARHVGPLGPYAATGKQINVSATALWSFSGPTLADAAIERPGLQTLRELGAVELFNSVPVEPV